MLLTDDLAVASTNLLAGSFLPTSYLLSSAMPSQRDDRPLNQLVADKLYSYARGFRANWVSAHSNLERLATDSIGFSVLKMALI